MNIANDTALTYNAWCKLNRRPSLVRYIYWHNDLHWDDNTYIEDDIIYSPRGKALGHAIWSLRGRLCVSSKRSREEALIKSEGLRWRAINSYREQIKRNCEFLTSEFIRITGSKDGRILVPLPEMKNEPSSWAVFTLRRGYNDNYYISSTTETATHNEEALVTLGRTAYVLPEGPLFKRLYDGFQTRHDAIWRRLHRLNVALSTLLETHAPEQHGVERKTVEFYISGRIYTIMLKNSPGAQHEYWADPEHIRVVVDETTRTPFVTYAPSVKRKRRRAVRSK